MALDRVCPACGTLNEPADVKVTDEMVERVSRALAGEDGDAADWPTNAGQVRNYHDGRARWLLRVAFQEEGQ